MFRPCGSTTNQSITFQEIQPYLLSWWHVVALISRSEFRSHNVRQLAACRCDRKACPETSVHPWRHQHHRSTNGQNPSNIRFDCCLQAYYSFNPVCVREMKSYHLVRNLGIQHRRNIVRLRQKRSSGWKTPGCLFQMTDAVSFISRTMHHPSSWDQHGSI